MAEIRQYKPEYITVPTIKGLISSHIGMISAYRLLLKKFICKFQVMASIFVEKKDDIITLVCKFTLSVHATCQSIKLRK